MPSSLTFGDFIYYLKVYDNMPCIKIREKSVTMRSEPPIYVFKCLKRMGFTYFFSPQNESRGSWVTSLTWATLSIFDTSSKHFFLQK